MPPEASGDLAGNFPRPQDAKEGITPTPPRSPLGAGYLVLVARELTGLSQRRLARRVGTSQPSLAKIESGSRIPTVRTLLRVAEAAGFELVPGLIGTDEDPPLPDELGAFALLGVVRPDPADDLADFVVLREPSVFEGSSGLARS
jgi:transcriptional regulator with XRE-family HTH domain